MLSTSLVSNWLSSNRGEIENISNKTQWNKTRQYKQRVSIWCPQDGIYLINVNSIILEVGFLDVIGNTLYADVKKLSDDTKKVFKCMYIINVFIIYHMELLNNKYLPVRKSFSAATNCNKIVFSSTNL